MQIKWSHSFCIQYSKNGTIFSAIGTSLIPASVFGIELTESAARASMVTAAATVVGRGVSQVLIGHIPGVGNIINASTAATVTEAMGWLIAEEFAKEVTAT